MIMRLFAYIFAALWLSSGWSFGSFIINSYRFASASGDPDFASVSLLLPFNGTDGSTTFTDKSSNAFTVTAGGNAQLDTAQAKWGASSLLLDGSGDYISIPDNPDFDFGTGDFTIEFWLRWNSTSGFQTIYDHGYTGSGALLLQTGNGDGRFIIYANGSSVFQESDALGAGVWGFYQLVRSGTTLTLYRNGVSKGSVTNSTSFAAAADLCFGAQLTSGLNNFNGWVDDVRITKGVVRSSTVPTAAFPES